MRSLKIFALIAMCAGLVLGTVASAYAYTGSQGTVYGQATMQPTVSIQLSGAGSDSGNPLIYNGRAGYAVWADGNAQVTVTNDGDVTTPILLGWGSDPTDGSDTWRLGTDCYWTFASSDGWRTVQDRFNAPQPLIFNLLPGDSQGMSSFFQFPSSFNGTAHSMQALLIASGVEG
jgi:hypothetical protein